MFQITAVGYPQDLIACVSQSAILFFRSFLSRFAAVIIIAVVFQCQFPMGQKQIDFVRWKRILTDTVRIDLAQIIKQRSGRIGDFEFFGAVGASASQRSSVANLGFPLVGEIIAAYPPDFLVAVRRKVFRLPAPISHVIPLPRNFGVFCE